MLKIGHRMRHMWQRITDLVSDTGSSVWLRLFVLCDYLWCNLFLRCTWEEYRLYDFYKYRHLHRKNYILKSHRSTRYYAMNPTRYAKYKRVMYRDIQRGIRREWLFLPETDEQQFLAFVKKHQKVIIKPDVGTLGWHVRLLEYTNDAEALATFYALTEDSLCEEYICQHEQMSVLNPSSVNSVRVVTLCDDGVVHIVGATLKAGGQADAIVDNLHSNGVGVSIDVETGVTLGKALDYHDHAYVYHPVTGVKMVGFSVPYWEEVLALVRATHLDVAECPYLGWDVAITPDGPEIIEINARPGPKLIQLMDQKPKGKYLRDYIRKHKIKRKKRVKPEIPDSMK